jgi:DNA-binding transcriptional LysR family regulator
MSDAFKDIPVFMTVVEAGNFSMAAERLNLSRSAVGKTIARLEVRLETRLFHRTTRSLGLTDAGQMFYEHCQKAMAFFRNGKTLLDAGKTRMEGKIRVTMPSLFGRQCVAPVLTRIAARWPDLELELNFNDRVVDLFDDGFDLAIRNNTPADVSGLVCRRIASQRMTVCAAPSYLETHGMPKTLADLSDHKALVYYRQVEGQRNWIFPGYPQTQHFTTPARMRMDDLGAIADATAAGLGLAWLPCWLIRDRVHSGALVWLLKDIPAHSFDSYAVWPDTPYLPMRVRMVIDTLAQELPGHILI